MIVVAHTLKAACCINEQKFGEYTFRIPRDHRYYYLLVAEVFVGLAMSVSSCFPAKMAYNWFPLHESTRAFVLATVGYNVGAGASNYIAPIMIVSSEDMYKMGYMFLISAIAMTLVVLLFINRSRPEVPPSTSAILSEQTDHVPLMKGLRVVSITRDGH